MSLHARCGALVMGIIVSLLGAGMVLAQDSSAPGAMARQILDATGVKGGLIVHVECGDGQLTAALRAHQGIMVHGLARAQAGVDKARANIKAAGLYGPVSVDRWDGKRLPYADNLINLLVCESGDAVQASEVSRVLVPNGVAYVRRNGQWQKTVKPRPADIDEWTHYLHDATGNPVSHDAQVGPPRRLQWVGSPRWARHHDHMASMTSLVAANGRLFYILDEGPTASIQLPAKWRLTARDAFNGTVLWKRNVESWNTHQWPLKSGPAHLTRRLVAVGDRVYVTLSLEAPTTALDAATGATVRTYEGSERTREIILSDGVLLVMAGLEPSKLPDWRRRDTYVWDNSNRANSGWAWSSERYKVMAYDAASGRLLWQTQAPVAPCSLAADASRVIFYDGEKVVCLSRRDGTKLWESVPLQANMPVPTSTGIRTLLYKDVVLLAGNTGTMFGLSAENGAKLWEGKHLPSGHQSLRDLFVVDGLVWTGAIANTADSGVFTAYDALTGEVKQEFPPDVQAYWFHHRCYPSKATDRYLLTSRNGIEFIDPKTEHWEINHWVRGGCIYGVLPCNGMVYAPMHSCGCYLESKLNGFNALAPGPVPQPDAASLSEESRLERGPAYGRALEAASAAGDWPTYRHDAARSGSTPERISVESGQGWRTKIGGRLTAPVIARGQLFVAAMDAHTLHTLDAGTGKTQWTYTAGGRIDSPPSVYRGLVLFGSADGYVYALRASDGALAWRYRAAPMDRRMVAFEQLESTWPVHGSVLVREPAQGSGQAALYCTAGRSIFLDGGIRLLQFDPATGRKLAETVMDERDPETGQNMQIHVKALNMPVALSDILSFDGTYLYMRSQKIALDGKRLEIPVEDVTQQPAEGSHLFCQTGFLDDSWFHRSFWTYGRRVTGGYGGWFQAARYVPAGRILVFDDQRVYGYGRKPQYIVNASVLEYQLFGADKHVALENIERVRKANAQIDARSSRRSANSSDWKLRSYFPTEDLTAARFQWAVDQPSLQVRAMVAAGDTLFVAGHPDFIDERRAFRLPDDLGVTTELTRQADALEGRYGGRLWAVSKADGRPVARYSLESPPVFDGMAAAGGRLYMSALDGSVACLALEGGVGMQRLDEKEPLSVISDEPVDPNYLLPPETDRRADFATVARCRIVEAPLGYRIRPNDQKQVCLALRKPDAPLTGTVRLACKLRVEGDGGGSLQNGFIAFGDGPADEQLVKCGIRYKPQKALVIQGELLGDAKSTSADVTAALGKVMNLTVVVDLGKQTVAFTANGTTVEAKLDRALASITHIGYCTDSAVAEFSALEVKH